jgi:hypothetical protein
MIQNDAQMQQNLELIEGMYRAIAELRRRIAPLNYKNYLIMAEGPIEQIRRLRTEIDEYLGIQEPAAVGDEPHAPIGAP